MAARTLAPILFCSMLTILAMRPGSAEAQSAGLPGGASSLTETYGNWTISCSLVSGERQCSLFQEQTQEEGRRVLTADLRADGDGLAGRFVLPFGLSLAKGVSMRIGEAGEPRSVPFSTCLPVGCLAPVTFDDAGIDGLRAGEDLILTVYPVDGTEGIEFPVPLAGFSAAADRTFALAETG